MNNYEINEDTYAIISQNSGKTRIVERKYELDVEKMHTKLWMKAVNTMEVAIRVE